MMNPFKIGAMVLFFTITILGFSLGFKIFPLGGGPTPASAPNQKGNTNKEFVGKLKIQNPLHWIENVQDEPRQIVEETKKTGIENSTLQKLLEEIQVLKWEGLGFGPVTQKTTETIKDEKSLVDYSVKILEAWSKNGFTEEEFKSIKKNKDGRLLSLEELIQEAIQGTNLEELKLSFKAWQMIDERTLSDLENISVNTQLLSVHQSMVSWFQYHSQMAGKLSKENLSGGEINNLFNQYLEKAKIETPKFQQVLVPAKESFSFIFIPKAQAQTEAAFYHFGGLVVSYADFCTNGFAVVIKGVKGGLLWIYYPVFIANPFLYKMLAPSYYVLGRALWGPGICNKGKVNYPLGMAQILFFGSSATPL